MPASKFISPPVPGPGMAAGLFSWVLSRSRLRAKAVWQNPPWRCHPRSLMSDSPEETALNRQWAQSRSEGAAPRVRTALATCDRAADSGIHGDFGLCLERTHCPCGLASSGSMVWQVPRYTLLKALSLKVSQVSQPEPERTSWQRFLWEELIIMTSRGHVQTVTSCCPSKYAIKKFKVTRYLSPM